MGVLNLLKNVFNISKEEKLTFKKHFEKEIIELEIFQDNKKRDVKVFKSKAYEYLLKTEIFINLEDDSELKLPYENIYLLEKEAIEYLELPKFFNGILKIENEVNFFNSNGVKFNYKFYDGENEYRYYRKNIILRNVDDKKFFLMENDYKLIDEINSYNNDNIRNKDQGEQFEIVNKINKLKKERDILLNKDILNKKNIESINKIEIDFKELENQDNLEIVPVLKGIEGNEVSEKIDKEFKEQFRNIKMPKKVYTVEVEGKKYEIVLNKKIKAALDVIKSESNKISKSDFLKKTSPIFQNENMDIEELEYNYGPRVKGLGFLNYRATAPLNNSDIEWFNEELPYIDTTDGEQIRLSPKDLDYLDEKLKESEKNQDDVVLEFDTEDGQRSIIMSSDNIKNEIKKINDSIKEVIDYSKLNDIKNLQKLMKDNKEDYVEYKGNYVKQFDDDEWFNEIIEKLSKKEDEKKEKEKEKVLLLKDNLESIEYIEKTEEKILENEYEAPKNLKENIELLPYQKEGVAVLQELYKKNKINGILLSDDMGLGKTLQILTFMGWLKEKNQLGNSLIVVPKSLILNWSNKTSIEARQGEIEKFFLEDTFSVNIISGKLYYNDIEKIKNSDINIISYETLRINQVELGKIKWEVMVCDEAQKIKNPRTLTTTAIKSQNANFKIACSATPIENTVLDLWCLVDFSKPGLLGSLKDFKKKYLIDSKKNTDEEELKKINDDLKLKLGSNFLRRMKSILNTQKKSFPKKIIKYINVDYSKRQSELMIKFNDLRLNSPYVLPLIQGMIMLCSHPRLCDKDEKLDSPNEILMEESSKLEIVKDILEKIKLKNEKVIIFTKYKKMQKILSLLINDWFGKYPSIINGESETNRRKELLDDFTNSQGFNIMILSPEAAGVGLNIVAANHVIHYTRHWNPAKEEQATDRTYRLGQKKDVYVYYPMIAEEIKKRELEFLNEDEWIESDNFNFNKNSSPEEKLNKIILKKKRLLRDFFLAARIDMEENDFADFKEEKVKDRLSLDAIDMMSWELFESFALIILEKYYKEAKSGYLTRISKDFGVDGLILGEKKIAIQAKQTSNKIGDFALEEVIKGKRVYEKELNISLDKVVVITNGEATSTLKNEKSQNIEIFDRRKLAKLLNEYPITNEEIIKKSVERYTISDLKNLI
ncbi:MAG: SNF2-related protein [Fusobacterium sp. JB019]|nr:SNF2-related protein [Fusobacterium sp. JB019]